jgi:hypothetical protein
MKSKNDRWSNLSKLKLLSPYFIEIMGGVGGYKSMAKNLSCFSSLD